MKNVDEKGYYIKQIDIDTEKYNSNKKILKDEIKKIDLNLNISKEIFLKSKQKIFFEEKKNDNSNGDNILLINKRKRDFSIINLNDSDQILYYRAHKNLNNNQYEIENNQMNTENIKGIECPYLGTIKRQLLDFDFEKVCSISLSNLNVYACLVCGKYYQGRGKNTHAYLHSLQEDHHLFINLNDEKIICLPEGYEVIDNSLKDIKLNLKPIYSEIDIHNIDMEKEIENIYSSALDGTEYIPGCIGLNNIKKTDYVNVIIQSLCRVAPLRHYFLRYDDKSANLVI